MKIWIVKKCEEHLDKDHQKQNLYLNLNLIEILKILLKNNIFLFLYMNMRDEIYP